MRTTRKAALSAAGVLSALLTSPPALAEAPPASVPHEVAVILASAPGSDFAGVYRRDLTASTGAELLVKPISHVTRADLAVARDGSRVAFVESIQDGAGFPLRDRVIVRDVNGPLARAVLDRPARPDQGVFDVALSPDGRTAVWTLATFPESGEPTFVTYRASVFAGAPVVISGSSGLVEPVFADATTLLASDVETDELRAIPLSGGDPQAVLGAPTTAVYDLEVSPSGTALLYQVDTNDPPDFANSLVSVPLGVNAGLVALGAPTVLSTSPQTDYGPTWRFDGASLLFVRGQDPAPRDVYQRAPDGTTTPLVLTAGDEAEVVVARIEVTPPGAVGWTTPATLTGTSASIPLDTRPSDADWSGTYYRRTTGTSTVTRLAPVGTRVVDTGMVVGQTYAFAFAAVDSSGNLGPWSEPRTLAATEPPVFATTDPTSSAAESASFPVRLSAVNDRATRYDVAFGRNGGAYQPWLSKAFGPQVVFQPGNGEAIAIPGSTYRFAGAAFDAHGNRTPSVGTAVHAVVPFDQLSMTTSGAVQTVARPQSYGGTSLFLRARGAQAGIRLVGNRFQVIGERGPTTGRFDVFVDGVRVATGVDTLAGSRQVRRVLFTRALDPGRAHTVVVRAQGTPGRPTVVVDGLSTRRLR